MYVASDGEQRKLQRFSIDGEMISEIPDWCLAAYDNTAALCGLSGVPGTW